MEGKVKWYNRKKGYGFIEGEDGGDYFIHYSALENGVFLREEDIVSFDGVDTDKGKQAQNVKLLQKGSEIKNKENAEEGTEEKAEEAPAEEETKEKTEEAPAEEEKAPAAEGQAAEEEKAEEQPAEEEKAKQE